MISPNMGVYAFFGHSLGSVTRNLLERKCYKKFARKEVLQEICFKTYKTKCCSLENL